MLAGNEIKDKKFIGSLEVLAIYNICLFIDLCFQRTYGFLYICSVLHFIYPTGVSVYQTV